MSIDLILDYRHSSEDCHCSVIMLTYNHQAFIADAIMGILNQDYKENFELIILDDCSTDQTWDIIEETIKAFKPKHISILAIRRNNNIGAIANFNDGLNYVSSDFIITADGDDISLPNRISTIIETDKKEKKSLYISNAFEILDNQIVGVKYHKKFDLDGISTDDLFTDKTPVFGASYAFKKELFSKEKTINPIFVTYNNIDQNIFWRAIFAQGVCYIERKLLQYRLHNNGKTIRKGLNVTVKNSLMYSFNRLGNIIYLYTLRKTDTFLQNKLEQELDSICSLLSAMKESHSFTVELIENNLFRYKGIVYKRQLTTLKTLKIDDYLYVLIRLFGLQNVNENVLNTIYLDFKQKKLTKNEIFFLFYLANKLTLPFKTTHKECIILWFSFFKGRMRILKYLTKINKVISND